MARALSPLRCSTLRATELQDLRDPTRAFPAHDGSNNSIEALATVNGRGMSRLSLHGVSRQPNSARHDKLSVGRHCRRPDKGRRRLARERCLRQANKRERVLRDLRDLEEGRRRELHSRRRAGRRPGTISVKIPAPPQCNVRTQRPHRPIAPAFTPRIHHALGAASGSTRMVRSAGTRQPQARSSASTAPSIRRPLASR
jgi:hypothetical protein